MASLSKSHRHHNHNNQKTPINSFINNTTSHILSLLTFPPKPLNPQSKPSKISIPILFADSPSELSHPNSSISTSNSSTSAATKGVSSGSRFPSTVRISGLNSRDEGRGPAFVGQVFSMCDLSGTGLMAVSTHFDIPFISKRTPEWIKKIFANATNSQRNGPVFRFFMDLGDAVSYVKKLNIPSGVVGACRLDLAFEHFKEKPHLFQFVANEKQVKEANRILKSLPQNDGPVKIDGVPVFTAHNLDIAIATTNGIKWYTPYFFDKNMLDGILEESVDQHFQSLIHNRYMQRRKNVVDDDMADIVEENSESPWSPLEHGFFQTPHAPAPDTHPILGFADSPILLGLARDSPKKMYNELSMQAFLINWITKKVQEVLDEVGHPEIPLSVITKAAEMQLLYAVDNVLLGNRWLRKATGIQPKFPYGVDTFEKRSAASLRRISASTSCIVGSKSEHELTDPQLYNTPDIEANPQPNQKRKWGSWFPFGDWISHVWPRQQGNLQSKANTRECTKTDLQPRMLLPKITMVGISTREAGQMSKASLKKTMEDLTQELEQTDHGTSLDNSSSNEFGNEDRDPLFVANIGDYYSGVPKTGTARWVRGG